MSHDADTTLTAPHEQDARGTLQLGGMALRNGVLVLGPTSFAVAVRDEQGELHVTSRPRPTGGEVLSARLPLLRGPVRLANMLRVLPQARRAEPRMRFGAESPGVIAMLLAGSIGAGMLRRRARSPIAGELLAGVASLAVTLATMRSGEVAAYHGAEHKVIAGYEQGIDAAAASRVHPRCGTQLALPMLAFTSIATQGALLVSPGNPRSARMVGQLVGVAAATELFRADAMGRRGRLASLARIAGRAGLALQRHATTQEPSARQLDVGSAALQELLAAERRMTDRR